MKHIIWLIICLAFAYGIAKYYPVEYVTKVDGMLEQVVSIINSDKSSMEDVVK